MQTMFTQEINRYRNNSSTITSPLQPNGENQMNLPLTKKTAIITVIILAVVLNFSIFIQAYPLTFTPQTDTLARDFSAYYMGSWRLFNNPTQVYYDGSLPVITHFWDTATLQVYSQFSDNFLAISRLKLPECTQRL